MKNPVSFTIDRRYPEEQTNVNKTEGSEPEVCSLGYKERLTDIGRVKETSQLYT